MDVKSNIKVPVLEKKLERKIKGKINNVKPHKICKKDFEFSIE